MELTFGPLFWVTSLVLMLAYVALEIYHGLSRKTGTVVRVMDEPMPFVGMIGCDVEVELQDGQHVTAHAGGCVICRNPIRPGLQVWLIREKDGWLVSSTKGRSNCGR